MKKNCRGKFFGSCGANSIKIFASKELNELINSPEFKIILHKKYVFEEFILDYERWLLGCFVIFELTFCC